MFIGGLTSFRFGQFIAAMFVVTMALLTIGLVLFLLEVRLAARSLKVRYELLESEAER